MGSPPLDRFERPHRGAPCSSLAGKRPPDLQAALEAGCAGFLEKTGPIGALAPAVRAAAAGEVVLSRADLETMVASGAERFGLTRREREVLRLVADGGTNRAIAEALHVSVNTVRTHMQSVLTKLGAHSKLEAVVLARRRGLL